MIQSDISRETLIDFKNLLLKWNNSINLISKNDIENIEKRHVADSSQLLNFIPDNDISIIDLGSGAGFPGIILSILGIREVTLIESDARKCAFLIQAAKLSLNKAIIKNERIEKLDNLSCNIITSRAFSDLNSIFNYSKNIKCDKYLLHKGETYQQELDMAARRWLFDVNIHDSITSDSGKILEITKLRARYE